MDQPATPPPGLDTDGRATDGRATDRRAFVAYDDARSMMVDGQIRPNKVYDPRILDAMRRLPREAFLPDHRRAMAYVDEDVPIGGGRVLVEPMVIARLLQIAAVRQDERVLVVGGGTGYGAALLAACGAQVTMVEDDAALLAIARPALAAHAADVRLTVADPAAGDPSGAPWDLILIEGAAELFPQPLVRQLRPGSGRLVGVRVGAGRVGQGGLGELTAAGELSFQPVFDCATPVLPALRQPPKFRF